MNRKEKEKQMLEMLEGSLVADQIKDILKKNIKKYSDEVLDGILESLARERVAGERLAYELMRFDADSQKRWDELAEKQIQTADEFVDQAFKELTSGE